MNSSSAGNHTPPDSAPQKRIGHSHFSWEETGTPIVVPSADALEALADSCRGAFGFADFFLSWRSAVAALPEYDPYSGDFDRLQTLVDEGDAVGAESHFRQSPNLWLSSRAHLALAQARSHDEAVAFRARELASVCCEGILSTGDGTQARSYRVLQNSDTYDILGYLGKGFRSQRLVEDGDRRLDRIDGGGSDLCQVC